MKVLSSPPDPFLFPAPRQRCGEFVKLLECAERNRIPKRPAQKQQHRIVAHCCHTFAMGMLFMTLSICYSLDSIH